MNVDPTGPMQPAISDARRGPAAGSWVGQALALCPKVMYRGRGALWRVMIRAGGGRCGGGMCVEAGFRLRHGPHKGLTIGSDCYFGRNTLLDCPRGATLTIGSRVTMTHGVVVGAAQWVVVGDDSLVGEYASIRDANHDTSVWGARLSALDMVASPVELGEGVWVGRGAAVLAGVKMGSGSVLGANAVLTGSIPSGAIAMGVPATVKSLRPIGDPVATGSFSVCCVLYGSATPPEFLERLPTSCTRIVLVDNSGHLGDLVHVDERITVLRPPRNLGYSAGINLAIASLSSSGYTDAIILANPDMELASDYAERLAMACWGTGRSTMSYPSGAAIGAGLIPLPGPISSAISLVTRIGRIATVGRKPSVPSGALIGLSRVAVERLTAGALGLLDPTLFSMDDADLFDRLSELNANFVAVPASKGEVVHGVGVSSASVPAISHFFRRASKIRYWRKSGLRLRSTIYEYGCVIESLQIILAARLFRLEQIRDLVPAARFMLETRGRMPSRDAEMFDLRSRRNDGLSL